MTMFVVKERSVTSLTTPLGPCETSDNYTLVYIEACSYILN